MKTLNAMELIEKLKNIDPLTPILFECSDIETGFHYEPVTGFEEESVRMTEISCTDAFDGTRFKVKQLMSCSMEKPNAFKALIIK